MPITGQQPIVVAIYNTDAGQSIPHGVGAIVDFDNKVKDTHDAVTIGAVWNFVAPMAGFYLVNAVILFNGTTTWIDGDLADLTARIGGVGSYYLERSDNHGSVLNTFLRLAGICIVYLGIGDELDIMTYQNSGAALPLATVASHNHISIVKYAGG